MIKDSPIRGLITATQVNVVSLSAILGGDRVRVLFSVFMLSSEVVAIVSLLLLLKLFINFIVYHHLYTTRCPLLLTLMSMFTIHDNDNALLMYFGPERTLIQTIGEGTACIQGS